MQLFVVFAFVVVPDLHDDSDREEQQHGEGEDDQTDETSSVAFDDSSPEPVSPRRQRVAIGPSSYGCNWPLSWTQRGSKRRSRTAKERKRLHLEDLRREASVSALLVTSADKLHNARCILADYRAVGGKLWDRVNVGRADSSRWRRRPTMDAAEDPQV